MRRWICLGMAALCALGLWYLSELWATLSGQSLYRLTAAVDKDMRYGLAQIASEQDADLSAFTVGEATLSQITQTETLQLYECLSYHPEAMGVLMVKGSPITQEQIERSEPVIMLSERAAMRLSPALECVDTFVTLDDKPYRVAGVYRHYEPAGFLTRTAEASAIVPMREWNGMRRLYVWLRSKKASAFVFEQANAALRQLDAAKDAGGFQAADLGKSAEMNRQGVRFWLLLMLSLFCWRAFKALSDMRRAFLICAKETFARYYSVRASIRLIWPFIRYIVPSLAVLAGFGSYLIYCANHLLVSAERVPKQLLDPEAWLAKQTAYGVAGNLVESMPVYAYLLNAQLQWICLILGLSGMCLLWIGLKPQGKRTGD